MIDDWTDIARGLPARPVQRLHVGSAILAWFNNLPKSPIRYGESPPSALAGVPIIYDKALHAGAWQGKDADGEVVASGQIGDPTWPIWYIPGQGFVQWTAPDLVNVEWWL